MAQDDPLPYGQYCPVSRAVEVLGERWSLLIVRDLLLGSRRFNQLSRCNPRLSRSLLAKRLRQLERAGIVVHGDDEYVLTAAGEALFPIVWALGEWGAAWQFGDPRDSELDAQLLMWWVHTRIDTTPLARDRAVMEFRFADDAHRFWVLCEADERSLCTTDPGFEVDVVVSSDVSTLYQVWLGSLDLAQALREARIVMTGSPGVVRAMPTVLQLSQIAALVSASRVNRSGGGDQRSDDDDGPPPPPH